MSCGQFSGAKFYRAFFASVINQVMIVIPTGFLVDRFKMVETPVTFKQQKKITEQRLAVESSSDGEPSVFAEFAINQRG